MAQDVLGRSSGKETFSKVFFRSKGWKWEFAFYSLKLIMTPVSGFWSRSSVSGTGLNYMQMSALIPERNSPLPSFKIPHFQNGANCTTFLVKMSLICMGMKNNFHIKDWAFNLDLIRRPGGTRKWPINQSLVSFSLCPNHELSSLTM